MTSFNSKTLILARNSKKRFFNIFFKIINLQKQVANHVRFIDDHCVDSEEIRSEMQKDIDRLVAQLEDQEKQNRTTTSLQTQVQRLEGNLFQKLCRILPFLS